MISVIVPIYNTEKYLRECIDSILAQTHTDFELLLIDDGSIDRSGEICDEYALKDSRIRVIHKENGGVGSARNVGLKHATGKWIAFVDADDILDSDLLANVDKILDSVDLCILNCKEILNNNGPVLLESLESKVYYGNQIKEFLSENLTYRVLRSPWGKLYRREVLNDIVFIEGQNIGEDTVFVFQYLQKCGAIQIINNSFYNYRIPEIPSIVKYKLNVDNSLLYLGRIFESYSILNVCVPEFEKNEYFYFKKLCSEDLVKNELKWYQSPYFPKVWKVMRHNYNLKYRIRIFCYSHKFALAMLNKYRKIKNSLGI